MDIEIPLRTDPIAAAELLRENRVLLIRHALEIGVVARYGAALRNNYQTFMEGITADKDPGRQARFRNEHYRRLHQEAGLAPHALTRSLGQSEAIKTLLAYFGTDKLASSWQHLLSWIVVWHHQGASAGLPYHQVGTCSSGLMVRAWIPIYPETAGDVSAGLEFLPTRHGHGILPIESNPVSTHFPTIETSHASVAHVATMQSSWAPMARLGDVILFTGDCLLRTRFPDSVSMDRYALQVTFYPAPEGICCHFTPTGVLFPTDDSVEALARGTATDAQYELVR